MQALAVLSIPEFVRKRDGKTEQPFDPMKVEKAIRGAWREVEGLVDEEELRRVSNFALASLEPGVAEVERVQDAIEIALMRSRKYEIAKAFILYRHQRSEVRAERSKPNQTALSEYIHASKYARYIPELQRREVFEETIDRVEGMHLRKFAHLPELLPDIRKAFGFVRNKQVLPSMRGLQFAGPAVEANNNRLYNCSASPVDRPRVFAEALFLLLCGCGIGYSVQFEHVEKLPQLADKIDTKTVVHHVIADTIEGWADAADALINSYIEGSYVEFSYHLIRQAGTPLKTSGGRAPGHMGLKKSLDLIRGVLNGALGRKLRPIECHKIMCLEADAVLSGGIRRAASICLFSLEDGEMMNCKSDRSWFEKEPWFKNANNSVVVLRTEAKEAQFKRIFGQTRQFGEPGILFVNDVNHLTNPCQPGWATVLTPEGIRTFDDISIGSTIWSGKQWTKVTNKVMTGVKTVKAYKTSSGTFVGTENHRVIQNGTRVEARFAYSIDVAKQPANGALVDLGSAHISSVRSLGEEEVYDITVEAEEHTYWTDGLLVSNCAEIGLDPTLVSDDGSKVSGWAMCNLCEINAAKLTSLEDFLEAAWAATLIGTLQASYTDMPYLGPVTEAVVRRDALLGIGMTGMQDAPQISCNPEYQRIVAGKVVEWNAQWAELIGINPAIRTTCVKPAGTTSLVISGVGSGIHPHHARRYIRRVTADELEIVFQLFKSSNPTFCVKQPSGKWSVEFPIEAPEGATLRAELTARKFMDIVKSTQQNWVLPGTTKESASSGLRHNVSNTITVRNHEWGEVADYLWENREFFTGISLLGDDGDQVYPFAPFEEIKTPEQERRWNELAAGYNSIDYYSSYESEDGTQLTSEAACAGGSCSIV